MNAICESNVSHSTPLDYHNKNRYLRICFHIFVLTIVVFATRAEDEGCNHNRQNKNLKTGLMLMLVSGLHIGWGIWRLFFYEPWMSTQSRPLFIFTKMSWYVTAIIGGFVGSAMVITLRKNVIYYISAATLIISSLIYIIWYDEYIAIIVGRCIAGCAHGIVYVTTVIHASENACKKVRGMVLSMINVMIFVSVTISAVVIVTVTYEHGHNMNSDRVIGIIGLIFSVGSVLCTILLTKESAPYLLGLNNDVEALDSLKELRCEISETWSITHDIQEFKTMVHEDQHDGRNIFTQGNAKPLVLMLILYALGVLSHNYLVNIILFNFLALAIGAPNFMLAPTILAAVRAAVGIISVFFADILGRKLHLTMTGFTLLIGIIIVIIVFFTSPHIWLVGSFAIAFQVFVAIGVDPIQHILLCEAFSTSKKPWSISFVTAFENLLQILFIGMYYMDGITSADTYLLVGICIILMLVLVSILQLGLPETGGMSLKEARNEFRDDEYSKHLCSGYDNLNCACRHS